jgi:hypothetical protein
VGHANINLGLYLLNTNKEARENPQRRHVKNCVGAMDAVPSVTQPYYKARWKFWARSSTASSPSLSRCANTSPGLTPGVSPMNQSALMSTFGGNIITSCGLQNVGAYTFETSERYPATSRSTRPSRIGSTTTNSSKTSILTGATSSPETSSTMTMMVIHCFTMLSLARNGWLQVEDSRSL